LGGAQTKNGYNFMPRGEKMDSTTQTQNEINENGQPGGAAKLMRQVQRATKRRLSSIRRSA
jgi:hypothetical protein